MRPASLDDAQINKAVAALLSHEGKVAASKAKNDTRQQLFDDAPTLWLVISLKTIAEKYSVKPVKIGVPHPWKVEENIRVCLITKDPQADYKKKIVDHGLAKVVHKTIGISKLGTKHKSYEAKRRLCGEYDVFLADERVLPLLPKLLGKAFFEKKKVPVPVSLTKKNLKTELLDAIKATYLLSLGAGPCASVKAGLVSQEAKQLVENVVAVIEQAVDRVPRKWDNIKSLYLKTDASVSLPIYVAIPEAK